MLKDRDKVLLRIFQDLKLDTNSIIASVASFPARRCVFKLSFDSIIDQVDHLFVYLNNYESIPDYLFHRKVTVFKSQDYVDLSASGKTFCLSELLNGYFFSLDDDILYPPDYVKGMISCLKKYNNKVGVSVHGSIFPEVVDWYFERYSVYGFEKKLKSDKFVNLIGSGTFVYHTDTLKADFKDFYPETIVDLRYSILAREQNVPLVCVARKRNWLRALSRNSGLYQQFLKKITRHTEIARLSNPWSFSIFSGIVEPVMSAVFVDLTTEEMKNKKLDIDFIRAMKSGCSPRNWTKSILYYRKINQKITLQGELNGSSAKTIKSQRHDYYQVEEVSVLYKIICFTYRWLEKFRRG